MLTLTDPDFEILGLEVTHESPEAVRLRASYRRSWFEVRLTVGGMLSHAALLLIVAAAWRIENAAECLLRAFVSVTLAALLIVMNAVSTFRAELWNLTACGDAFSLALAWSRVLMGGGAFAIALAFAATAIGLSRSR